VDLRDPPEPLGAAPGFAFFRGDVANARDLQTALRDVTALIHCAALLPHQEYLGRERYYRTNVVGTERAFEVARELGLERAVHISTVGVLRPNSAGVTGDDSPYRRPPSLYHWSKIEAERRVAAVAARGGICAAVLRPASIYGPGMSFKWIDIARLIHNGRMRMVGSGRTPYQLIHVDDLVEAIVLALGCNARRLRDQRITIVSPEQVTIVEILNSIAEYYGAPRPKTVPYSLALLGSLALTIVPDMLKPTLLRQVKPYSVREYRIPVRFDDNKAARVLGFRAQIRFREGIRGMLSVMERVSA
jgi:nucleoside-diphosphate-sugar epimerase